MHRPKTLFILSIIVMVIPHLGITNLMEQVAFFAIGLVMIIFSYGLYFEYRGKKKEKSTPVTVHTQTRKKRIPEIQTTAVEMETDNTIRPRKQFSEEMTGFRLIRRREDIVEPDNNLDN